MPPSLILGGYRVVRALGRGSIGVVYEATGTGTGRRAALNTLSTELARDPGLRERFVREARVGMALHHPNIVEVYEAGEANGQPYLAMEYLEGADLETSRARPSCPWNGSWTFSARPVKASLTRTPTASCTATSSPATSGSSRAAS